MQLKLFLVAFLGLFLVLSMTSVRADYVPSIVRVNITEDAWMTGNYALSGGCQWNPCINGERYCAQKCPSFEGMCEGLGDSQLWVAEYSGSGTAGLCAGKNNPTGAYYSSDQDTVVWFDMTKGITNDGEYFEIPSCLVKNATLYMYSDGGAVTGDGGVYIHPLKYEDKYHDCDSWCDGTNYTGDAYNIMRAMRKTLIYNCSSQSCQAGNSAFSKIPEWFAFDSIWNGDISGTPRWVEWNLTNWTINRTVNPKYYSFKPNDDCSPLTCSCDDGRFNGSCMPRSGYDVMIELDAEHYQSDSLHFIAQENEDTAHHAYMEIELNPSTCGDGCCLPVNETWENCPEDCGSRLPYSVGSGNILQDDNYINDSVLLYSENSSYNMTDDESNGVFIANANNFIFDCNNSEIIGDGNGWGFNVNGHDNVTIRNCTWTNFNEGVHVGSSNVTIINVTFENCTGNCIDAFDAITVYIDNVTINGASGSGILINSSANVELKNVNIFDTVNTGVTFCNVSNITINNLTSVNQNKGIVLQGVQNVSGNNISINDSLDKGIFIIAWIRAGTDVPSYGINLNNIKINDADSGIYLDVLQAHTGQNWNISNYEMHNVNNGIYGRATNENGEVGVFTNGYIEHLGNGVYLESSDNITLDNITVFGDGSNDNGIYIDDGSRNITVQNFNVTDSQEGIVLIDVYNVDFDLGEVWNISDRAGGVWGDSHNINMIDIDIHDVGFDGMTIADNTYNVSIDNVSVDTSGLFGSEIAHNASNIHWSNSEIKNCQVGVAITNNGTDVVFDNVDIHDTVRNYASDDGGGDVEIKNSELYNSQNCLLFVRPLETSLSFHDNYVHDCNEGVHAENIHSNILISDTVFVGGSNGINLFNTSDAIIDNCTLSNFDSNGIQITNSDNVTIDDSTVYNTSGDNVWMDNITNIDVRDSNFMDYYIGIHIDEYGENITIQNNTFNKVRTGAGHCVATWGNYEFIYNIDIIGNDCNETSYPSNPEQVGYRLEDVKYFNITDNYASHVRAGIWLGNTTNGTIDRNRADNIARYGIQDANSDFDIGDGFLNITNNEFISNIYSSGLLLRSGRTRVINNTFSSERNAFQFIPATTTTGNVYMRDNNFTSSLLNYLTSFYIYGENIEAYDNDIDTSNTANGRPIFYNKSINNTVISSDQFDTETNLLFIVLSNNVTVKNQNVGSKQYLQFGGCSNCNAENINTNHAWGGIEFVVSNGTMRKIKVENSDNSIACEVSNCDVYDSTMTNNSAELYVYQANMNMTNVTYDNSTDYLDVGANVFRKWWIKSGLFGSPTPLSVNILLKNRFGNTVLSNISSLINLAVPRYRMWEDSGNIYYEEYAPYNLTLWKNNYGSLYLSLDMLTNYLHGLNLTFIGIRGFSETGEDIGQGVGNLLLNMSNPLVIFIILLSVTAMFGFIIASISKKTGEGI
jgi:hypothetical protein